MAPCSCKIPDPVVVNGTCLVCYGERSQETYMLLSLDSGNAIDCYETEQEARAALAEIEVMEPEALPHVGVIAFDAEGLATRTIH